jgi:hypothetical protein
LRLGLRRPAKAVGGIAGGCLVGVAASVVVVGFGPAATAIDQPASWSVTVGSASSTLFPGTAAAMAYDVRNATSSTQRLQGTSAELKNDGAGVYDSNTHRYVDDCLATWFRISGNSVATGVDVAPGASVHGSLNLAFDDAPVSQDACRDLGLEVVVTAT